MTSPVLSNLNNETDRFYRHSGKVPPVAGVMGLLAGFVGGAVVGGVGGFAEMWAHLIPSGKLSFLLICLLICGMGFGAGAVGSWTLTKFKARSQLAAVALGVISAAAALYAAWTMWLYAYWADTQTPMGFTEALHPANISECLGLFYDKGEFTGRDNASGVFLALLWGVEAVTVLGVAVWTALRIMDKRVYCETCDKWGHPPRWLMQVSTASGQKLRDGLLAGSADALTGLEPSPAGVWEWCDVGVEGCGDCDTLQTVSVDHTTMTVDKKGGKKTKKKCILKRFRLRPEQTVELALAGTKV